MDARNDHPNDLLSFLSGLCSVTVALAVIDYAVKVRIAADKSGERRTLVGRRWDLARA